MAKPKKSTQKGKKTSAKAIKKEKRNSKGSKSPKRGKAKKDITQITKDQWLWIAGVLVIGFIALLPTLQADFINYDDDIYITENPYIVNFTSQPGTVFGTFYKNQYAPIAMTIMGVEYQLFGPESAFPFKFFSILLHLLNAFLVFKVVRSLFEPWTYALVAMLLFAVHPMQVESITWTTASMKVGMFTAFFLAACWTYLRFIDTKKQSMLIWTFVLFLLSCMSKEQGLALSVVLILLDYMKGRDVFSTNVLLEKSGFLVVSLIFGFVTLRASANMQGADQLFEYAAIDRILFVSYAIAAYWFNTLVPINLSAFYTYPLETEISFAFKVAPLFVGGLLAVLIWAFRQHKKVVVFAIVFFFLNLGLTLLSQILATRDVMMADRYMYLPIIGLFVLMAYGLHEARDRFKLSNQVVFGVLGIYIAALAFGTYQRSTVWQNSISVFSDVIEKADKKGGTLSPSLSLVYNNRGIAYKDNQQIDLAKADYERAIQVNPADAKTFTNLGNLQFLSNDFNGAIQNYTKSINLKADSESSWSSRGAAYASLGNYNQAEQDLLKALEINPTHNDALRNISMVNFYQQKWAEGINRSKTYLNLNPGDADMINQLGTMYLRNGNNDLALQEFNRSIQMNPNNGIYYQNRALLFQRTGNRSAMIQDAQKAQS
ncbi:MAG: tetratricopeptide repeat protein, partial [Bacteroidota bacterium]